MLSTIYSHQEKIKKLESDIKKLEGRLSREKRSEFISETRRIKEGNNHIYDFIVPWQM